MDTALPQKFPFILDRNLAKANCTGDRVCTSCDTVVFGKDINKLASLVLFCHKFNLGHFGEGCNLNNFKQLNK